MRKTCMAPISSDGADDVVKLTNKSQSSTSSAQTSSTNCTTIANDMPPSVNRPECLLVKLAAQGPQAAVLDRLFSRPVSNGVASIDISADSAVEDDSDEDSAEIPRSKRRKLSHNMTEHLTADSVEPFRQNDLINKKRRRLARLDHLHKRLKARASALELIDRELCIKYDTAWLHPDADRQSVRGEHKQFADAVSACRYVPTYRHIAPRPKPAVTLFRSANLRLTHQPDEAKHKPWNPERWVRGGGSSLSVPNQQSSTSWVSYNEQLKSFLRQEGWVRRRVQQLIKSGMWSAMRLPKVVEPSHRVQSSPWSQAMSEMQWMAIDFHQERQWKVSIAHTLACEAKKWVDLRDERAAKMERKRCDHGKAIARSISDMVRHFWLQCRRLSRVGGLVDSSSESHIADTHDSGSDDNESTISEQEAYELRQKCSSETDRSGEKSNEVALLASEGEQLLSSLVSNEYLSSNDVAGAENDHAVLDKLDISDLNDSTLCNLVVNSRRMSVHSPASLHSVVDVNKLDAESWSRGPGWFKFCDDVSVGSVADSSVAERLTVVPSGLAGVVDSVCQVYQFVYFVPLLASVLRSLSNAVSSVNQTRSAEDSLHRSPPTLPHRAFCMDGSQACVPTDMDNDQVMAEAMTSNHVPTSLIITGCEYFLSSLLYCASSTRSRPSTIQSNNVELMNQTVALLFANFFSRLHHMSTVESALIKACKRSICTGLDHSALLYKLLGHTTSSLCRQTIQSVSSSVLLLPAASPSLSRHSFFMSSKIPSDHELCSLLPTPPAANTLQSNMISVSFRYENVPHFTRPSVAAVQFVQSLRQRLICKTKVVLVVRQEERYADLRACLAHHGLPFADIFCNLQSEPPPGAWTSFVRHVYPSALLMSSSQFMATASLIRLSGLQYTAELADEVHVVFCDDTKVKPQSLVAQLDKLSLLLSGGGKQLRVVSHIICADKAGEVVADNMVVAAAAGSASFAQSGLQLSPRPPIDDDLDVCGTGQGHNLSATVEGLSPLVQRICTGLLVDPCNDCDYTTTQLQSNTIKEADRDQLHLSPPSPSMVGCLVTYPKTAAVDWFATNKMPPTTLPVTDTLSISSAIVDGWSAGDFLYVSSGTMEDSDLPSASRKYEMVNAASIAPVHVKLLTMPGLNSAAVASETQQNWRLPSSRRSMAEMLFADERDEAVCPVRPKYARRAAGDVSSFSDFYGAQNSSGNATAADNGSMAAPKSLFERSTTLSQAARQRREAKKVRNVAAAAAAAFVHGGSGRSFVQSHQQQYGIAPVVAKGMIATSGPGKGGIVSLSPTVLAPSAVSGNGALSSQQQQQQQQQQLLQQQQRLATRHYSVGGQLPSMAGNPSRSMSHHIQTEVENMMIYSPDWIVQEDWAIVSVVQHLLKLHTATLIAANSGHTVNWDLIADVVNTMSRAYRGPRQCRLRFDSAISPREEGRTAADILNPMPPTKGRPPSSSAAGVTPTPSASDVKVAKRRLNKRGGGGAVSHGPDQVGGADPSAVCVVDGGSGGTNDFQSFKSGQAGLGGSMRTFNVCTADRNVAWTSVFVNKFEQIRAVANRRTPTIKPLVVNPNQKRNARHAQVLADSGIVYNRPVRPSSVATFKTDRALRDKQRAQQQQQHQQQQVGNAPLSVGAGVQTFSNGIGSGPGGTTTVLVSSAQATSRNQVSYQRVPDSNLVLAIAAKQQQQQQQQQQRQQSLTPDGALVAPNSLPLDPVAIRRQNLPAAKSAGALIMDGGSHQMVASADSTTSAVGSPGVQFIVRSSASIPNNSGVVVSSDQTSHQQQVNIGQPLVFRSAAPAVLDGGGAGAGAGSIAVDVVGVGSKLAQRSSSVVDSSSLSSTSASACRLQFVPSQPIGSAAVDMLNNSNSAGGSVVNRSGGLARGVVAPVICSSTSSTSSTHAQQQQQQHQAGLVQLRQPTNSPTLASDIVRGGTAVPRLSHQLVVNQHSTRPHVVGSVKAQEQPQYVVSRTLTENDIKVLLKNQHIKVVTAAGSTAGGTFLQPSSSSSSVVPISTVVPANAGQSGGGGVSGGRLGSSSVILMSNSTAGTPVSTVCNNIVSADGVRVSIARNAAVVGSSGQTGSAVGGGAPQLQLLNKHQLVQVQQQHQNQQTPYRVSVVSSHDQQQQQHLISPSKVASAGDGVPLVDLTPGGVSGGGVVVSHSMPQQQQQLAAASSVSTFRIISTSQAGGKMAVAGTPQVGHVLQQQQQPQQQQHLPAGVTSWVPATRVLNNSTSSTVQQSRTAASLAQQQHQQSTASGTTRLAFVPLSAASGGQHHHQQSSLNKATAAGNRLPVSVVGGIPSSSVVGGRQQLLIQQQQQHHHHQPGVVTSGHTVVRRVTPVGSAMLQAGSSASGSATTSRLRMAQPVVAAASVVQSIGAAKGNTNVVSGGGGGHHQNLQHHQQQRN